MRISKRYSNIISLFQTAWYLPRHVIDKGVVIFERLGTPDYQIARAEFYQNKEESPELALPGKRFNPHSDDPRTRLLGRMGVHETENGTAVVPVYGVLAKRMSDFDISETGTSTDMLSDTFEVLNSIDRIRGVVLDIDSPGGSVLGTEMAARSLRELSDNKPVSAVANDIMASGAYYIGAQAREIFVTPSAYIGSVGVYTTRVDLQKFYEDAGVKVYVISRGEYKTDGHPNTPFTDDERQRIQEEVDTYYYMFVDAVKIGRGIAYKEALALADGSLEIGEKAIERGFADAVADLSWATEAMDTIASSTSYTTGGFVNGIRKMNIFGKGKKDDVLELDQHKEADDVEVKADDAVTEAALAEAEKRIQEREEALIQREVKADFDDLIKNGNIVPKQREYLENLAFRLRLDHNFHVSVPVEGVDEPDVHGAYESLMSALMMFKQVEYSEIVKVGNEPPSTDFDDPASLTEVLNQVMAKEGFKQPSEALQFVKEQGIPPYVTIANGE